jgi:hypothetical protein
MGNWELGIGRMPERECKILLGLGYELAKLFLLEILQVAIAPNPLTRMGTFTS